MTRKMKSGFMALTAVMLVAMGTLAYSISTMAAAISYADRVSRKELRIQASLNAESCLKVIRLMAKADHFLKGQVIIGDLGCKADIQSDFNGNLNIDIESSLEGVRSRRSERMKI